ncbi:hypothetical protein ES288_A08G091300v1 [Gossypium darwinii]|uniref:Uncharacterized protein n=1 Tax=Gossypium darwinii TaxID=34276 RepID=A0A5D2FHX6_GOSDA|nr:hypothetical protein ES288_A08G091300v1 [Gossypium darwinii]
MPHGLTVPKERCEGGGKSIEGWHRYCRTAQNTATQSEGRREESDAGGRRDGRRGGRWWRKVKEVQGRGGGGVEEEEGKGKGKKRERMSGGGGKEKKERVKGKGKQEEGTRWWPDSREGWPKWGQKVAVARAWEG